MRLAPRNLAALAVLAVLAAPVAAIAQTLPNATPKEAASALGTADVEQAVGQPQGSPLSGAALERRTAEIADLLRCPVCQGMSIADSPSSLARKMKSLVRSMLAAGYDEKQILAYFQYSYGEFVLLRPPMKGVSATVWLAPIAGLLLGGGVIWWWMRRSNRASASPGSAVAESPAPETPLPSSPAPEASSAGAEAELEPYLERVRRLVGGEPSPDAGPGGNES